MLDLLPDALIDHLSQWLSAPDRCSLARACSACTRVHLASDWRKLRCSMRGLVGRRGGEGGGGGEGGDASSPHHWTRDLAALFRLLRRPMFERLERVHLDLDARCFASGVRADGEERADDPSSSSSSLHFPRRFAAPTMLRSVSHLHIRSALRLSSSPPSTLALRSVVRAFPSVRSVTLCNLSGVGHSLVRHLLRADSPLLHLSLRNCTFAHKARNAMTALLLSHPSTAAVEGGAAQQEATMQEEGGAPPPPSFPSPPPPPLLSWPSLASFEFTGRSSLSVVRRAAGALGDRPLHLPPSLGVLDMGEATGTLSEMQLLLTLAFLPHLSELVVSAKSQNALDTVDLFRPGMFRHLTVRIQV